jgi:hypothetical protein
VLSQWAVDHFDLNTKIQQGYPKAYLSMDYVYHYQLDKKLKQKNFKI